MKRKLIRCAIYTRKSSEEGLDQEFNSLDAQHESCAAYIASQAGEGWRMLPDRYDDGGISGGTMDRPALQQLLADISLGKIDTVVVYKIDRLTRSLGDFSRMVEVFDRHEVSFVSVTQAFNTTNSMGRLTLNVLLSFAQFEREVTGERIRDKIAASKAKGMWMGGTVPYGYDAPSDGTRVLKVNIREAEHVRALFAQYLELDSVPALQDWARKAGIRSKARFDRNGNPTGGAPFGRGALLHLLRNPVYLGKIVHMKTVHDGLHDAIVDETIFNAAQQRLDSKTSSRGEGGCADQAALTGRIFDATGERMSPTFAIGGSGRKYRYYVSTSLQKGARRSGDRQMRRVSARHVEAVITARLREIPSINQMAPLDLLRRVDLYEGFLVLSLPSSHAHAVAATLREDEAFQSSPEDRKLHQLTLPFHVETRGGKTEIAKGGADGPSPDPVLIRALREAHRMVERDHTGRPCVLAAPTSPYRRKLIRLAFLAPHIQRAIMSGQQPPKLTLASLMAQDIPVCWQAQARVLGMPSP